MITLDLNAKQIKNLWFLAECKMDTLKEGTEAHAKWKDISDELWSAKEKMEELTDES